MLLVGFGIYICSTLTTLDYGNFGIFLVMGNAGFYIIHHIAPSGLGPGVDKGVGLGGSFF